MTTIILFGITGDLAKKKLVPALAELFSHSNALGQELHFLGFGRKAFSPEEFENFISESAAAFFDKSIDAGALDEINFTRRWGYIQSELTEADGYKQLASAIQKGSDVLAYISLPPQFHMDVVRGLSSAGLLNSDPEAEAKPSAKLVFEKPFGTDAAHAKESWAAITGMLSSENVFLVDHYGAKEPLLEFERLADTGAFKKMHESGHITGIRAALIEKKDANGRGSFYDSVGALKDVGQNHVLRMLTTTLQAVSTTDRSRAELISSLHPQTVELFQYDGFSAEPGVAPDTRTETFFRIHDSFEGIKIELSAGKAAAEDDNSFAIVYKDGKDLRIAVNAPGAKEAYVTVFERALAGDKSVFASIEEVLASWDYISRVKMLAEGKPVLPYQKGFAL